MERREKEGGGVNFWGPSMGKSITVGRQWSHPSKDFSSGLIHGPDSVGLAVCDNVSGNECPNGSYVIPTNPNFPKK